MLVGVSKDSLASHKRFAEKYDLDCYLLADPGGTILAALGVQGIGGRARRTTYVIDKSGIVRFTYENVSVKGHAEHVLFAVRSLG